MSLAHRPHSSSTEFSIYLKSIGQGRTCPPSLRCPRPLDLSFGATYYDLEDGGGGASQSPWVGNIDLEEYYFDRYSPPPGFGLGLRAGLGEEEEVEPPRHPGYQLSPVGQLQIIVKSPMNAIKVFLVPYDLRSLPIGGRLLARERTYVHTIGSSPSPDKKGEKKETLRYAYQLQFICLATEPESGSDSDCEMGATSNTTSNENPGPRPKAGTKRESSTTRRTSLPAGTGSDRRSPEPAEGEGSRAYYLSRTIKVVFTSTPPESDQQTRIERTDEVVPVTTSTSTRSISTISPSLSSAGFGTSGKRRRSSTGFQISSSRNNGDWEIVRRKWIARRDRDRDRDRNQEGSGISISESAIEDEYEQEHEQEQEQVHQPDLAVLPSSSKYGSKTDHTQNLPPLPLPKTPSGRGTTPKPQPFNLPPSMSGTDHPTGPGSGSTSPRSRIRTRTRQQRRTSAEERELSEKLRTMSLSPTEQLPS
jgi:hypothetical protein